MRRISLIVTLPLTLVILVFAVANRAPVTLSLWPFPWQAEFPGYLVILGSLLVGFAAGTLVAWASGARRRRAQRRDAAEARRLAQELAELKRRHAGPPTAPPPAVTQIRASPLGELPPR